jgi:hypothetical protein
MYYKEVGEVMTAAAAAAIENGLIARVFSKGGGLASRKGGRIIGGELTIRPTCSTRGLFMIITMAPLSAMYHYYYYYDH